MIRITGNFKVLSFIYESTFELNYADKIADSD